MSDVEYRPGLEGVPAGKSAICRVDHESGGLIYRGYLIHDLAAGASYEEVAYLLLYKRLPNKKEVEEFSAALLQARTLPGPVADLAARLPTGDGGRADPMDLLRTGVSLLGALDPDRADNGHEANLRKSIRLIAQIPTLMALAFKGPSRLPLPSTSHAEHLLKLITGKEPSEEEVRAMNVSLILYAEHEFNASTFAARTVASSLSDLHSAVTAAIGSLKGPLHGGANERVMEMFLEIGEPERAEEWVKRRLANRERIMGFGHRVLKKGDARSDIIKEHARRLSEARGETKWFLISERIERLMREAKGLFPNLDFYTASTYYLLGIPIPLYTPLFVCSRVAGWCAHIIEQHDDNRLIRPRSLYTGPENSTFVPLDERK